LGIILLKKRKLNVKMEPDLSLPSTLNKRPSYHKKMLRKEEKERN